MKILFPILFVLLSISAFMFGVNPFYKDVSLLKDQIEVYNTALDSSTNLQRTEDALIKTFNGIREVDKERLNKLLPSSVDNIQFILEVERIANSHGMPIKDLNFQPIRKKITPGGVVSTVIANDTRPYGVFPVEFTTEGDYDTFVKFLKDLESNLRILDVKTISFASTTLTKEGGAVNPNVYKYTLEVETYWLK